MCGNHNEIGPSIGETPYPTLTPEQKEKLQSVKYHNLHQHSSVGSNITGMLDAYGTVGQVISRCKDIGYEAVALTDHGSVTGHLQLIRQCKEEGLKPLCGCEMYIVDDLEVLHRVKNNIKINSKIENLTDEFQEYKETEQFKARQKFHFNVIAKNQQGLHDLWKFVSKAWTEGFYYKPSVDWKTLYEKPNNCWFGTACEIGPLGRVLDHYNYMIQQETYQLLPSLKELDEKLKEEKSLYTKSIRDKIAELKARRKKGYMSDEEVNSIYEEIESFKDKRHQAQLGYNEDYKNILSQKQQEVDSIRSKHLSEGEKAVEEKLNQLLQWFGNNLYVEIIPEKSERARWKFLILHKVAKKLGVRIVCTNDSHAPSKEDTLLQDLLYTKNLHRGDEAVKFGDKDRTRYTPQNFYIHSTEEMFLKMKDVYPEFSDDEIIEMMNNSYEIVQGTDTVREEEVPAVAYFSLDDKPTERGTNFYKLIQDKLKEGWIFRQFNTLEGEKKKEYLARLNRELEVILFKGYIDYFLIMADIMDWCDKGRPFIENFEVWYELNGHSEKYRDYSKEEIYEKLKELGKFNYREPIGTGIARGSAGGSLVAYLLRITNIDPMPGKLLFERFIDYTRGNVYYNILLPTYPKSEFKKEFPEIDLEKCKELEQKYKPIILEKTQELLQGETWYDKLQLQREFWLLQHNQQFDREQEYFYRALDKLEKGEIKPSSTNDSNSIFAWLMGLTTQEPKGDYIVSLTDIPDIDSDFEDVRRNEVYEYLQHRYGIGNSCRIATYGKLKAFSTIDLLSKIFYCRDSDMRDLKKRIAAYLKEQDKVDLKKDMVDDFMFREGPTGGLEYLEKYSWLEYVKPLLGQTVNMGMHAAGMIVHNNPVSNYGAIYITKDRETKEQMTVICWDCVEAESIGLMKLDILGLNTVTSLKRINEIVTDRYEDWNYHWQRIPNIFEDPKTKRGLEVSDNVGLFQLEGSIMTFLSKEIRPTEFQEIVTISAGGRPGPLEDARRIGAIKFGKDQPYYYNNKKYEEITKLNKGIVIYQEDLMRISKEICGYDDKMVGYIRKMVSKVKREEIRELEPDFIKRLIENGGMSPEDATRLWTNLVDFGSYSFNKCLSLDSTVFYKKGEKEEESNIKSLYEEFIKDKSRKFTTINYNEETQQLEEDEIVDVMYSGKKEIYEIELEDGRKIKSSKDHKFKTNRGWLPLEEITSDDTLYVIR